jgi:hypothetical protein
MKKTKINVTFDFHGGEESKGKWLRIDYAEMRSFSHSATLAELEQVSKEIIYDLEIKYGGQIDFVKIGVMAKRDEKGEYKYINR